MSDQTNFVKMENSTGSCGEQLKSSTVTKGCQQLNYSTVTTCAYIPAGKHALCLPVELVADDLIGGSTVPHCFQILQMYPTSFPWSQVCLDHTTNICRYLIHTININRYIRSTLLIDAPNIHYTSEVHNK